MKWVVRAAALLVSLICLIAVIGWFLPETHIAARSAEFRAPQEIIWTAITDVAAMPEWRPDLERVEILLARDQHFTWRETSSGGDALTFVQADTRPPSFLLTRIVDEGGPFGGEWVHELRPTEQGSVRLTITERGWVRNPFFRFVSQIVIGHTATIDAYIVALGAKLGESVTIVDAAPAGNGSGEPSTR